MIVIMGAQFLTFKNSGVCVVADLEERMKMLVLNSA